MEDDTVLKIFSWNINGIRSVREDFTERVTATSANIICIQETKVTRDMLEESVAVLPGFSSYFAFSRRRTGYSGVATFCRSDATPVQAEEGITGMFRVKDGVEGGEDVNKEFTNDELRRLDAEGRCVMTRHKVKTREGREKFLVLFNLYCPRADPERPERKELQLKFYRALDIRANRLRERGDFVVIVGDINTSHKQLDHCDPSEDFGDRPGRRFLDHFLEGSEAEEEKSEDKDEIEEAWQCESVSVPHNQFLDSFRIFHPKRESAFTCWHTALNCRETNYGTRIDYVFIDKLLKDHIEDSDILPEVMGSDHCPVQAIFKLKVEPALKPPAAATKYFPEFSGKQQNLRNFFQPADKNKMANKRPNDGCDKNSKKAKQQKSIQSFFKSERSAENNNADDKLEKEGNKKSETPLAQNLDNFRVTTNASSGAWKNLMKGPPVPKCKHNEECHKLIVTKKGINLGRHFWACKRGTGRVGDKEASCDFFKWLK